MKKQGVLLVNLGSPDSPSVSHVRKYLREFLMDGRVLDSAGQGPLLLKLDVEGEERRIVPALASRLPRRCAVFFETHHGDEGWNDVAGALRHASFEVRCLREREQFFDGFALRT